MSSGHARPGADTLCALFVRPPKVRSLTLLSTAMGGGQGILKAEQNLSRQTPALSPHPRSSPGQLPQDCPPRTFASPQARFTIQFNQLHPEGEQEIGP